MWHDHVERFDGDDDNTKRYETPFSKIRFRVTSETQATVSNTSGDIGAAIEFDIDTHRAKVVLLWQNVERYEWIDFKNLFIQGQFYIYDKFMQKDLIRKRRRNTPWIKIIKTERNSLTIYSTQ